MIAAMDHNSNQDRDIIGISAVFSKSSNTYKSKMRKVAKTYDFRKKIMLKALTYRKLTMSSTVFIPSL